jgi:hypothetical protein
MENDKEIKEELIEHYVKVDKYMTVIMSIPKQMSADTLKYMTMKANKLFNMSEMENTGNTEFSVPKTEASDILSFMREHKDLWGRKKRDQLVTLVNTTFGKNFSKQQIQHRIYYLIDNKNSGKKSNGKIFSADHTSYIIANENIMTPEQIAEGLDANFGLKVTANQVTDKIHNIKHQINGKKPGRFTPEDLEKIKLLADNTHTYQQVVDAFDGKYGYQALVDKIRNIGLKNNFVRKNK